MLIRSQSKKTLINMGMVKSLYVNSGCICADLGMIGEYSSDEKALKVLDQIQILYSKYYYSAGGANLLTDGIHQAFGFNYPKVFQMPQDEEVII